MIPPLLLLRRPLLLLLLLLWQRLIPRLRRPRLLIICACTCSKALRPIR